MLEKTFLAWLERWYECRLVEQFLTLLTGWSQTRLAGWVTVSTSIVMNFSGWSLVKLAG